MKKIDPPRRNPQTHPDVPQDDLQSLKIQPDEQPTPAEPIPVYQQQYLETERAALLEALRVKPSDGIATKPLPTIRIELAVPPKPVVIEQGISVQSAEEAQKEAQAKLEAAKAELEKSEKEVAEAKARAQAIASTATRESARTVLTPLVEQARKRRASWQHVHDSYAGTLRHYGQSCASGDLAERTVLMAVYSAAPGCLSKIAKGYKACEDAIRAAEKILDETASADAWSVDRATADLKSALELDVNAVKQQADTLVSRYASVRPGRTPGYSSGAEWRPTPQGGPDAGIDTRWRG